MGEELTEMLICLLRTDQQKFSVADIAFKDYSRSSITTIYNESSYIKSHNIIHFL